MRFLNLLRIILCGLVSGTVFSLVNAVLVDKIGSEFLAAAGAHTATGDGTAKTGLGLYLATVAAGIWAMWLYTVVRPLFSSGFGAAIAASLAWWLLASLQSLKWILLLGIPLSACVPLTANVVPTVIAVFVGSFLLSLKSS